MIIKTWTDIQKITGDVLLNSFSPTKRKLLLNNFFSDFQEDPHNLFILHHISVIFIIYNKTLPIIQT